MKLNEQTTGTWIKTDKVEYIKKKQDSNNFEVNIEKNANGDDEFFYKERKSTSPATSESETCIEKHFQNDSAFEKKQTQFWFNQSEDKLWVFSKNKNFSYRNPSDKNKLASGYNQNTGNGVWECDSENDFIIEFKDGSIYSSKTQKTHKKYTAVNNIFKIKVKPDELSGKSKDELEKISSKLDEYKEQIKAADWWGMLKLTWVAVKKKVNDALYSLSVTPSSAETPSNEQTKKTTPVSPENPEDVKDIITDLQYPNDKNYRYGKKGGEWYAKNVKTNKIFNISKYEQFDDSVKRLDNHFPNVGDTLKTSNDKGESNVVVSKPESGSQPEKVIQQTTTTTTLPKITPRQTDNVYDDYSDI